MSLASTEFSQQKPSTNNYTEPVFTRLKYDFRVETWRGEHENAPKMLFEASRHGPHVPLL